MNNLNVIKLLNGKVKKPLKKKKKNTPGHYDVFTVMNYEV